MLELQSFYMSGRETVNRCAVFSWARKRRKVYVIYHWSMIIVKLDHDWPLKRQKGSVAITKNNVYDFGITIVVSIATLVAMLLLFTIICCRLNVGERWWQRNSAKYVQDVIKDYIDPKPPTKLRNNFYVLAERIPFPYQNGRFQFHNETIPSEVYTVYGKFQHLPPIWNLPPSSSSVHKVTDSLRRYEPLIKPDCLHRYLLFFFAIHRLAVIAGAFLINLPPPNRPLYHRLSCYNFSTQRFRVYKCGRPCISGCPGWLGKLRMMVYWDMCRVPRFRAGTTFLFPLNPHDALYWPAAMRTAMAFSCLPFEVYR